MKNWVCPFLVLAALAQAETLEIDISEGSLTIAESTYTVGSVMTDFAGSYVITGSTSSYTVTVSSGEHEITLKSAAIDASNLSKAAFKIASGATVHLTITGKDTLTGGSKYAGLAVPSGATLEITEASDGRLIATGGSYGAGIGGDYSAGDCGTVIIAGGEIVATGGSRGAGIGGGYNYNDESIGCAVTITGGTVTATGTAYGAGIGGGYGGNGGTFTMSGGTVDASGGSSGYGAGIGGGSSGNGGTIIISGGTLSATGGTSTYYGGAGIGGGNSGTGGYIKISGGTIVASGGGSSGGGAGIGGGYGNYGGTIVISGGKIAATGGGNSYGGAGIGGGKGASAGTITISGGEIEAIGVGSSYSSAGIGGGSAGNGGTITISGGTVIATAGTSSKGGAGIGGGGGSYNGNGGDGGTIEVEGGILLVTRGSSSASTLGMGYGGSDDGYLSVSESAFLIENPTDEITLASYVETGVQTLGYDCSWPSGYTLYIGEGDTLTVASGYTFTNYDTIYVYGTLNYGAGYGTLVNEGVIIYPDSVLVPAKTARPELSSSVQGGTRSLTVRTGAALKMKAYDLRGSLVKAAEIPAGGATIGGFRPGVYVVKLSSGAKWTARVQ